MGIRANRLPWALVGAFLVASCSSPTVTPPSSGSSSPSPAPSDGLPASTAPSEAASVGPTSGPTAAPTAAVSTGASTAPSPAGDVPTGLLRGTVYDASVELVPDGTKVTVVSMDATKPFEGTVETSQGVYVVNRVPLNTQVRITASRPGWTSRTQVAVVRAYDPRFETTNVFNFGGKAVGSDATERRGISYFLSDHPEIARVEPTDGDTSQANDEMRFKLTLSEPLDAENRRRLAAAFLIIPNNDEAIGEDMAISEPVEDDDELDGLLIQDPDADATAGDLAYAYAYRQNAAFLNGAETASFAWDDAGLTATFTLKAPVKTDKTDEAEYAFVLRQADDDLIEDADGNPLGMDETGKFGQTTRGDLIYNAIAEPSVNLTEGFDDEEERWADTHLTFTTFAVEEDTTAPNIEAVVARRNFVDDEGDGVDRIEITFSEPMIAYPRIASTGLLSLDNYVLAAAPTEAALADLADDGSADEVGSGSNGETVRDAFDGSSGIRIDAAGAEAGNFRVSLSVRDPRVVVLELPPGSFPLDADFIKIRATSGSETNDADSVTDPAGNAIPAAGRTQVGPIY